MRVCTFAELINGNEPKTPKPKFVQFLEPDGEWGSPPFEPPDYVKVVLLEAGYFDDDDAPDLMLAFDDIAYISVFRGKWEGK